MPSMDEYWDWAFTGDMPDDADVAKAKVLAQHKQELRDRVRHIVKQIARMQCTLDMADRLVDVAVEDYESAVVMTELDYTEAQ